MVATARKPEVFQDLAEKYPETVLTVKLDVKISKEISEWREKTIATGYQRAAA